MFKNFLKKKKKQRSTELQKLKEDVLNSSLKGSVLGVHSSTLETDAIIDKDCTMLITCLYSYSSGIANYKTGLLWANVTVDKTVEPLTLWDKYGKIVSDVDISDKFTLYCMLPSFQDNIYYILKTYTTALEYANSLPDKVDLDAGLLNVRDLSLLEHDSDLVLYFKKVDNKYILGATTNEGVLKGMFINLRDVTCVEPITENMKKLELKDIIEVYENTLKYDLGNELDADSVLLMSMIIDKLKDLKGKIKNCNLYHIMFLMEGLLNLKVTYLDNGKGVDGRTTCKLAFKDKDAKEGTLKVKADEGNHVALSLRDLKLHYNDRRVKINLSDLDEVEKHKLLEDMLAKGKATLEF